MLAHEEINRLMKLLDSGILDKIGVYEVLLGKKPIIPIII